LLLSDPEPSLPLKVIPGNCRSNLGAAWQTLPEAVTGRWVAVVSTAGGCCSASPAWGLSKAVISATASIPGRIYDELDCTSESRPAAGRFSVTTGRRPPMYRITGHYPVVSLAGRCS